MMIFASLDAPSSKKKNVSTHSNNNNNNTMINGSSTSPKRGGTNETIGSRIRARPGRIVSSSPKSTSAEQNSKDDDIPGRFLRLDSEVSFTDFNNFNNINNNNSTDVDENDNDYYQEQSFDSNNSLDDIKLHDAPKNRTMKNRHQSSLDEYADNIYNNNDDDENDHPSIQMINANGSFSKFHQSQEKESYPPPNADPDKKENGFWDRRQKGGGKGNNQDTYHSGARNNKLPCTCFSAQQQHQQRQNRRWKIILWLGTGFCIILTAFQASKDHSSSSLSQYTNNLFFSEGNNNNKVATLKEQRISVSSHASARMKRNDDPKSREDVSLENNNGDDETGQAVQLKRRTEPNLWHSLFGRDKVSSDSKNSPPQMQQLSNDKISKKTTTYISENADDDDLKELEKKLLAAKQNQDNLQKLQQQSNNNKNSKLKWFWDSPSKVTKQSSSSIKPMNRNSNRQGNVDVENVGKSSDDSDEGLMNPSNASIAHPKSQAPKQSLLSGVHSAADVLQCQESVIEFVINATDSKDECDGLIRAYDQTCRIDDIQTVEDNNNNQIESQTQIDDRHLLLSLSSSSKHPNFAHQKIWKKTNLWDETIGLYRVNLQVFVYQNVQWIHKLWWNLAVKDEDNCKYQRRQFLENDENDKEEVIMTPSEQVIQQEWDDVKYLVDNGLASIVYQQVERRLFHESQRIRMDIAIEEGNLDIMEFGQDEEHSKKQDVGFIIPGQRRLESGAFLSSLINSEDEDEKVINGDEEYSKDNNANDDRTASATPVKIISTNTDNTKQKPEAITIPTKKHHLTAKTAEDAVILGQSDSIFTNASYPTSSQVKSSDAVSTTQKATNTDPPNEAETTLIDPTSTEARTCCASILNAYHELCNTDDEEVMSDSRLVFCVIIVACCGIVKSLIKHFGIVWLPEAAGCILVGVASGYILNFFPHHDVSFDEDWFLRILVPPIIFEAALSIDKRAFNRHIIPIMIYSVMGTVVATILTALIVHYATNLLSPLCMGIPIVEALTFGALISSIDPIAVLSVLSNMGITDTETIYVLIFGESLLNDGVAIVLFHTLVHFLDENLVIDKDAIFAATIQFFAVAAGSLTVGIAAGSTSTIFFWLFHGCQTALVEVIMFFCWALLPYYVCDGIGWSGIVAAVAVGFVMDIYIVGEGPGKHSRQISAKDTADRPAETHKYSQLSTDEKHRKVTSMRRVIFGTEGHLSKEARKHIGFVLEIISTSMETAIFAYLGFFMFSMRYHWNKYHIVIAVVACLLSRAIMVPAMSIVCNWLASIQRNKHSICAFCAAPVGEVLRPSKEKSDVSVGIHIDRRMQVALWFAGLRGAMSFALVEHIPLYDSFSGRGTRLKPELKAMTSASIMFTVFILGGSTFYIFQRLGIDPNSASRYEDGSNSDEKAGLMMKPRTSRYDDDDSDDEDENGIGMVGI